MRRPQIIRLMAAPNLQQSASNLAHPSLLMGQRWVASSPHTQQLRPMSVRRRYINKELKTTLQQARQLRCQEERRQVFFDVARRYTKSKGSSVDLKDSPKRTVDARRFGAPTQVCNVTVLNPHNLRYSIQRSNSRDWKVWVAVDAEFDFSSPDSHDDEFPPEMRAPGEPLVEAVVWWMNNQLAEACKGTSGHTEVNNGHVEVPETVDFELLFWDTVISLELNTRTRYLDMNWMGKIGEKQPRRFEMTVIPTHTSAFSDI